MYKRLVIITIVIATLYLGGIATLVNSEPASVIAMRGGFFTRWVSEAFSFGGIFMFGVPWLLAIQVGTRKYFPASVTSSYGATACDFGSTAIPEVGVNGMPLTNGIDPMGNPMGIESMHIGSHGYTYSYTDD